MLAVKTFVLVAILAFINAPQHVDSSQVNSLSAESEDDNTLKQALYLVKLLKTDFMNSLRDNQALEGNVTDEVNSTCAEDEYNSTTPTFVKGITVNVSSTITTLAPVVAEAAAAAAVPLSSIVSPPPVQTVLPLSVSPGLAAPAIQSASPPALDAQPSVSTAPSQMIQSTSPGNEPPEENYKYPYRHFHRRMMPDYEYYDEPMFRYGGYRRVLHGDPIDSPPGGYRRVLHGDPIDSPPGGYRRVLHGDPIDLPPGGYRRVLHEDSINPPVNYRRSINKAPKYPYLYQKEGPTKAIHETQEYYDHPNKESIIRAGYRRLGSEDTTENLNGSIGINVTGIETTMSLPSRTTEVSKGNQTTQITLSSRTITTPLIKVAIPETNSTTSLETFNRTTALFHNIVTNRKQKININQLKGIETKVVSNENQTTRTTLSSRTTIHTPSLKVVKPKTNLTTSLKTFNRTTALFHNIVTNRKRKGTKIQDRKDKKKAKRGMFRRKRIVSKKTTTEDFILSQIADELSNEFNRRKNNILKQNPMSVDLRSTIKMFLPGSSKMSIPFPENNAFCHLYPQSALCGIGLL